MTTEVKGTGCCPPFTPEPWHDKVHNWQNKLFIREKVRTLWYMPLNFGGAMTRIQSKLEQAGAESPDWLTLSDHTSKWNMDILLAVDREIKDAENTTISGSFYSRVYEGSFRDTGLWHVDFKKEAIARGYDIGKYYMWYTTCPKCARTYGKNYVVIICEVSKR
jgi:hypothetical protein